MAAAATQRTNGNAFPSSDRRKTSLAFKLSLLILTSTSLIFLLAFSHYYYYTRELLMRTAKGHAQQLTLSAANRIEAILQGVEKGPLYLAASIERQNYDRQSLLIALEDLVLTNPRVFGSTVAYAPHAFDPGYYYFAPYYYRDKGSILLTWLGSESYPYHTFPWYLLPKEQGKPVWTEPYYDDGGGNIVMSTFAVPFYRHIKGVRTFSGVVTADISLERLVDIISRVSFYKTGFAFLISRKGVFVTHPDKNLIMRQNIFALADAAGDPELQGIGKHMIRGGEGFVPLPAYFAGKKSFMYYAPIASTGWSVGVVLPEEDLYADLHSLTREVVLIGVAGFFFLFIVISAVSRAITSPLRTLAGKSAEIAKGNLDIDLPTLTSTDEVGDLSRSFVYMRTALKEYISNLAYTTAAQERIESELKIARTIQMSFLPKFFPEFPKRKDFTIYATLEPAREVGGDLYDFFLPDKDHLFLSIGDVSGKGVPASLFMAVTKTLMKGIAEQGIDPSDILKKVNAELAQDNDSMMFVTLFCGIVDLKTGSFKISNAGHNPPVLIRNGKEPQWLSIPQGIVLGVTESPAYATQTIKLAPDDTIVLYTDGVTEAMNIRKECYSNEQLLATIRKAPSLVPKELVDHIMQSVKEHAGQEPQSDDITIMVFQFKGA